MKGKKYLFWLLFLLVLQNIAFSAAQEQTDSFFASSSNSASNLKRRRVRLIREIKILIKKRDFKSAAVFLKLLKEISSPNDAMAKKLGRLIEKGITRQRAEIACRSADFILSYRQLIDYQLNRCDLAAAQNIYISFRNKCRYFIPSVLNKISIHIKKSNYYCRRKKKQHRRISSQKQKLIKDLIKRNNLEAAKKVLEESRQYFPIDIYEKLHAQILDSYRTRERQKIDKAFEVLEDELQKEDYRKVRSKMGELLKETHYNTDYVQKRSRQVLQIMNEKIAEKKAAERKDIVERSLYKASMILKIKRTFQEGRVEEAKMLLKKLKSAYPQDAQVLAVEREIKQQEQEFNLVLEGIKNLLKDGYYLQATKMLDSLNKDYPVFSLAYKKTLESLWHQVLTLRQRRKMVLIEQLEVFIKRGDYKNASDILVQIQKEYSNDKSMSEFLYRIRKMIKSETKKEKELAVIKKLKTTLDERDLADREEIRKLINAVENKQ